MQHKSVVLLFTIGILIGSMVSAFSDSVKGTLTVGGKVIELKNISAEYVEDVNVEGEQVLVLRLSDVEPAGSRKSELREQAEAGNLNFVEFIFDKENKITTVLILSNAFEGGEFFSGQADAKPQNITVGPETVKGTLLKKDDTAGQKWEMKADFEVPLPEKD